MGDTRKKLGNIIVRLAGGYMKKFWQPFTKDQPGAGSLIPVPIPVYDPYYPQHKLSLEQQPSRWTRCVAWVRYHSIQLRWDIERFLARLLHSRWT